MDPERWKQVDSLLQAALECPSEERDAFLRRSCVGDETLEREVRSLLASDRQAGSFLESPAIAVATPASASAGDDVAESSDSTPALVGRTIAHYRILSKLGRGGMGVVYEAQDLRLGRRCAVKFLLEDRARDPRVVRLFEREARAASALNHPNICTIYEVEEYDGRPMIVMELLEGNGLQRRIREGPAPADELLSLGIQVSDALQAAHSKGIIHRDIKPGNIFIVAGGRVKILDFGLAKIMPARSGDAQASEESLTLKGFIPGTTAYLSPEGARGEEIDARSDLFSLGAVLYELATARQPFARDNTVLTIDAILNACPPAPTSVNPGLPSELDIIIGRLLEKDRNRRYQSAAEVRADLERLKRETDSGQAAVGPPPAPARRIAGRSKAILAAATAAIVALSVAGYFYIGHFRRTPKLTEKDTIVLADFTNTTGDAVFDGTLRQGLAVQLEQSPFLSLVSEERIQQTLRLMGQPADARLTPERAREVCERTASAAVLEGSIALLGSQYVLGLRARNCGTGDILDDEQAQAGRKEDVLSALDEMASKFRTRAGESLATVKEHHTPLAEATTSSLDALRVYSAALKVISSTGAEASLPLFKRAIEIDPGFAMAHAFLGRAYGDLGEAALSAESTRKAYQLRGRSSDWEKFWIDAAYDTQVTENLEKAQETCEAWLQTYPREVIPHAFLSGIIYSVLGKHEEAVEESKKAIGLDPDFAIVYFILAKAYQYRERLAEAEHILDRASERKLEIPDLLLERYDLAFLKGDEAGVERIAALAKGKSESEEWIANHEGSVLAYSGHAQQAGRMAQQATDLAEQAGHREAAALYTSGAALWEGFFGDAPAARRTASAALALSRDRGVEYGVALALALTGDSQRAQTLATDLAKRFPEDTSVQFSYLPALRARLALNRGDAATAIELLQAAAPNELGAPRTALHGNFGALYPVYMRGEAYLAARQGAQAAAEFQKILNHPGIVVSDPIGALARLQLARALALSGDQAKAQTAYQSFFTLWKDADPDIPILKQVKAEYVKMQ